MFQVVIVGRPNVGKSTLFNRLCGVRKSIVGDEPGITRDRIYGKLRLRRKTVSVLDTGGMLPEDDDVIPAGILAQVEAAVKESHLVLLVVDGRVGVTPLDQQLLPMMRRTGKPIFTVVNKIDAPSVEPHVAAFHELGTEQVFGVSAEHDRGIGDLVEAVAAKAKDFPEDAEPDAGAVRDEEIKVAVVGRPNVGKSSLVNRLLGFERSIVTDVAGTTRDAVDTLLLREGVRYRIIDTAGIRRKGKAEGLAEKVSVVMAQKSMRRADVALLLLDAEEGVTKLDAAIGGYAYELGCSVVILLNKWDLVEKDHRTLEAFQDSVRRRMKYLAFAPILTVSALTGQRVSKVFDLVRQAAEARKVRIPTGTLNNTFAPDLEDQLSAQNPNLKLGINYITQVSSAPPTFVVFVSGRDKLHFSTERYLVNQLREQFGFFAAPIRIQQKTKESRTRGAAMGARGAARRPAAKRSAPSGASRGAGAKAKTKPKGGL
ncbi:MAG: ribosome biogenesis GTPase Der [Acidobacteriota bacterium]|jgi:GTP-binding protein|nr:ribosome biogenesis GTPase Der [Acidobacteriota bacterium]